MGTIPVLHTIRSPVVLPPSLNAQNKSSRLPHSMHQSPIVTHTLQRHASPVKKRGNRKFANLDLWWLGEGEWERARRKRGSLSSWSGVVPDPPSNIDLQYTVQGLHTKLCRSMGQSTWGTRRNTIAMLRWGSWATRNHPWICLWLEKG